MDVAGFLRELRDDPAYAGQIVAHQVLPAREADFVELDPPLPALLTAALERVGVGRLYRHQAAAVSAARGGRDVLVVTGTASGKTLCYNLPVLETVLADRRARALYLFPLKALGRDQLRQIDELDLWRQVRCAAYDGDTGTDERRTIREHAQVVLTNPDMLHLGLLPHHGLWAEFFAGLRFVVLDEVHTYRGVFGSHMAHVLARLQRVCRLHGAAPQFIGCSATVGNPTELFERLTGRPAPVLVDRNGAPSGRRHLVVWNPPTLADGRRRSGNIEATFVLRELVRRNVRTLGFALARAEAELILRYLRAALDALSPELVDQVAVYRAGYLAEDRRRLEQGLADGALRAVISTVALEAGIDIGGLDAVVMIGYPGTMAGFWQQAGRAGRDTRDSLALLVCRESLVDQFFAHHPETLWQRPTEAALIDPENLYIATGHLLCAAYERPLAADEVIELGDEAPAVAEVCAEEGWLRRLGDRWAWAQDTYPAAEVNLRAAGSQPYDLVDPAGTVMATEDDTRLWDACYPGAVYLLQGETWRVAAHDEAERRVRLEPVTVDYFTQPEAVVEVTIDAVLGERDVGELRAGCGELTVTKTTVGFRRLRQGSFELIDREDLAGPPRTVTTIGLWLTVGEPLRAWLAERLGDVHGGLHATEHALCGALPLVAMCDGRDVEGTTLAWHPGLEQPAAFLFDVYPGGIGLTEKGYHELDGLLAQTRDLIEECPCEAGCPACITRQFCGTFNQPLDKLTARILLRAATGRPWRDVRLDSTHEDHHA